MKRYRFLVAGALLVVLSLLGTRETRAHCDGMDGPVVKAGEEALSKRNVNLVLVWVKKDDEAEIREAFDKTISIRKLGPDASKLADRYFFETLVRVHRAGEGAPYTGLKPAGRDLGPAIPAADHALESGSEEELVKLVTATVEKGLREQFRNARAKRTYDPHNVSAGREYVQAYVEYVHYVERIYDAAKEPAHGHFPEESSSKPGDSEHHHHDHK